MGFDVFKVQNFEGVKIKAFCEKEAEHLAGNVFFPHLVLVTFLIDEFKTVHAYIHLCFCF